MSKYTVSQLDSTDQLNQNDLLMVSTMEEDGTYSSRNITFGAFQQQVGEGSTPDSTGNQETDIINFFTPASTFKVTDSRFIKGNDSAVILVKSTDTSPITKIKVGMLSEELKCLNIADNNVTTYPKYTPITNIPNDIVPNPEYNPEDPSDVMFIRDSNSYFTYDNTALANINNMTISAYVEVKYFGTDDTSFTIVGYNSSSGQPEVATFNVVKITAEPSRLNAVVYSRGTKDFSKFNITLAQLKKFYNAGYKYMIVFSTLAAETGCLNWHQATYFEKTIDFTSGSYVILTPKKSTDVTTYASNSVVYTEDVTINEPCAVYIHASFTCERTTQIGQSYYIELQVKATANGDESWYPIYRKFADMDNQYGRTSFNHQIFARAGVKLRGVIYPQGNAGKIYYNQSNFTFILCKTSGQFTNKEESVQILNVEFKNTNSNAQTIANTELDAANIVGRWITLDGNFSTYGGYRRSKIDTTSNMYCMSRRIQTNEVTVDGDSGGSEGEDGSTYDDAGTEDNTDEIIVGNWLQSPQHTNPTSLSVTEAIAENISILNHKVPFHTLVLNNKNNSYSTYEYFIPAKLSAYYTDANKVKEFDYSIQLMSAQGLGNNSQFRSYGPNSAIINKTAVSTAPSIPANNRTTLIFYPKRGKLSHNFNNNTQRDSTVGLYKIAQTSKQDMTNLAELEMFDRREGVVADKYHYSNIYEKIEGASQLYYCTVYPPANKLSSYTSYQANINLNDTITSFAVSNKTAKYALNIGKRLKFVPNIAQSVESFDDYCFYDCTNLKSLPTAEISVSNIGNYCFYNCKKLEGTLKLNKVASINGTATFANCSCLNGIQMSSYTGELPTKFAYNCQALTTADFRATGSVGEAAFGKCTALTAATTNFANVTTIGNKAFVESGVKTVSLAECTEINELAFSKCAQLTSVTLPKIKILRKNAFSGCTSLTSVTVGSTLELIEASVFASCPKNGTVFDFTALTAVPTLKNTSAFPNNNKKNTWKIKVAANMVDAFKNHKQWGSLKEHIEAST